MNIVREKTLITGQEMIADGIYDMTVRMPQAAATAKPGQFAALYCHDGKRLLPRPISICQIDREAGTLRFVYRIAGAGTGEFSGLAAGDSITVMGPLGNGFPLLPDKAILIGGGIGIPPMLALAEALDAEKTVALGYRDQAFLKEEFEPYGRVVVASEDGSMGTRGTVLDAIREQDVQGSVIYACGPMPMLKAVAAYAEEKEIPAYISLEERMACGIGACLGCICPTKNKNEHTNVNNSRICKDGPVFNAGEVVFS